MSTSDLRSWASSRCWILKYTQRFLPWSPTPTAIWGAPLAAAARAGKADTVEIVLKPIPRSQNFLDLSLRDAARRLFENPETRTSAQRFLLKGSNEDSNKIDLVDVLSDELIATKKVLLQDELYRSVSSDSAYNAIEEAYKELHSQLLTAFSVAVAV